MSFRFKQFNVNDDRATMKVGTDAVLLGSWVNIKNAKNILEIGTGSGVIALMIAQRSLAYIDAIEIDKKSAQQAAENFKNSPWNERLQLYHSSLNAFIENYHKKYNLIISNPPFFINSLNSPKPNKTLSKHTVSLNYSDLLKGIEHFLDKKGRCCLILPVNESLVFGNLAQSYGMYLNKQLLIKPKAGLKPNRVLMEFSFTKKRITTDEMFLRETDNSFSTNYRILCKDFYLNL